MCLYGHAIKLVVVVVVAINLLERSHSHVNTNTHALFLRARQKKKLSEMIAQGEVQQGWEIIWTFSATHVDRKWTFRNGQWSFPNFLPNRLYKSKDT